MPEIFRLPTTIPSPERNRQLFESYSHELDGKKRRIFVSRDHADLRSALESFDPWNIPADATIKAAFGHNRTVQIINEPRIGRIVAKELHQLKVHRATSRVGFVKRMLDSTYKYLFEDMKEQESVQASRTKEMIVNGIAQDFAGLSLVHQLSIGRQLAEEYEAKFHVPLKIEEPLAAYVNQNGQKVIVYRYYEGKDKFALSEEKEQEYSEFRDSILDKNLYKLGYLVSDLQFLVLDDQKPIDHSNIVVIDIEHLVPITNLAKPYKGRPHKLLHGQ